MTFCIYQHVDGEATEVPSIPIHFYWIFGCDEEEFIFLLVIKWR